jgi:predicted DsbA family dithiol-disulfide isomerase
VHLDGEHLCQTCLAKKKRLKEVNITRMPKILILFKWQQKSIRREKPKGKSKDDQAKHLQGWTKNPIKAN